MKRIKFILFCAAMFVIFFSCSTEEFSSSEAELTQSAIDLAQTSGQLASGTSFLIAGSSADSTGNEHGHHGHGAHHGPGRHKGILDGTNLLAPTDELLAIVEAESAGDIRGLRISHNGGATITHYDANGDTVTLQVPRQGGPQGCSYSGNQYPAFDSLLSLIVKTEIDFGSGVTYHRDTVEIIRAGKIIINRSLDENSKTEVTTFEGYTVNDIQIAGTKTRISTYDTTTGIGSSITSVSDGLLIFPDGTTAEWKSEKARTSEVQIDESTGKVISGIISTEVSTVVTASDGTIIYSHKTTSPLIENIACDGRRKGPINGLLETIYRDDTVLVDYGNGTCSDRTITITLNGVSVTKTIG
jgi:hypothetical protein